MTVTVRFIQKDEEEKKASFNPRPYFRLFINWLLDLGSVEPAIDGSNFQVWLFCIYWGFIILIDWLMWLLVLQILTAFANAFHALQPLKVPAFRLVSELYILFRL